MRERRLGERRARALACLLPPPARDLRSPSRVPQTPATALSCAQQIVATVTVENNRLYETERLEFSVSCVNRCRNNAGERQSRL